MKVKSLSRVRLFATSWTVAYQAPPSVGFSRQEYWSGLPFPSPGDLPNPGIEPGSPALQADALPSEPPGKFRCKSPEAERRSAKKVQCTLNKKKGGHFRGDLSFSQGCLCTHLSFYFSSLLCITHCLGPLTPFLTSPPCYGSFLVHQVEF